MGTSTLARAVTKAKRTAIIAWDRGRPTFHLQVGPRRLAVQATRETAWLLNWRPDWKTWLIDRLLGHRPGLFVDVGANIGQTLLDYAASAHRHGYVGFEPEASAVEQIQRVIAANGLDDCRIVPAALSDRDAPLELRVGHAADQGASLIHDLRPSEEGRRNILIASYRYDSIADTVQAGRTPGVIKIDVEGAESSVVEGMAETLRRWTPLVFCEVLNRDPHTDAAAHEGRGRTLYERLDELGYDVFRLNKSEDLSRVTGLTPVEKFPTEPYSKACWHTCDYLFAPRGAALPF